MTKTLKVHFFRSKGIAARIICVRLNSYYNHVSLEANGYHYQARMFKGVTKEKTLHDAPDYTIALPFSRHKQADAYIKYLDGCVGKGYDYLGVILGFFGTKKRQNPSAFFCSELANTYFTHYCDIQERSHTLVSPKDLYNRCMYFSGSD